MRLTLQPEKSFSVKWLQSESRLPNAGARRGSEFLKKALRSE